MRPESEAKNEGLGGGSTRRRKAMTWAIILVALVVALILILPAAAALAAPVTKDGNATSASGVTVSSLSWSHTTGTGTNRLLLVSVSWNCGSTDRTISSVTFTPSGGSALPLTLVKTQLTDTTSAPRYSAVYRLVAPPQNVAGTVAVNFSGSVSNGIVAGAANFAGVDQTTPLGTAVGAASTNNTTVAVAASLTSLLGTELIFDNVFNGASATGTTLTPDASQSQLWSVNGYAASSSSNTMGGASTKQASSSSLSMNWTASSAGWWAIIAVPIRPTGSAPAPVTFSEAELLGQPTNNSMTVKVMPDSAVTLRCQYGTTSGGSYTNGSNVAASAGTPATVTMSGLSANTKYYYRVQYSTDGGTTWQSRDEHYFYTQRAAGSTFTFDITTDSHINISLGDTADWTSTLNKVAADHPDFLIDLGDTFAMDNGSTSVALGDTAAAEQKYKDGLPFFNIVSAGSPTFFTAGNHEQQEAWHLQGTLANSLPVMGKNAEKKFYLNPVPGGFYSGDTTTQAELSGDHLKQDYYSWTWGDALFVVISPYWTTTTKPYTTSTGGGETDATGSDDRWDWTLGQTQFNWLKATLAGSTAKYKFVFSHQITGSDSISSMNNYGHGGVNAAIFCEWGGYNINGTTWAWDTERAGWGSQPIRQMMKANGTTAFFHGHDHQMAYESLDGIVYQSCPSGSFDGSFGDYTTGGNSGNTIWADSSQGPGYMRVTVGPSQTNVEFIRYNGSSAAYSYSMTPAAQTTFNINLAVGWNLLAATPGTTGFPASLFGWTGSAYQSVADPVSWNGYWCKAAATGTVTVTPTTGPKTINLTTGWNLIGNSMSTAAALTLPSGRSAFVYDTTSKSYVSVTSLQPGQGAWVKGVNAGETVVLTGS
jgi:hypothetical protein